MNTHDLLMLGVWPLATALLNLMVMLAGQSEKPWAQMLARVGTVLLSSTKAEKK